MPQKCESVELLASNFNPDWAGLGHKHTLDRAKISISVIVLIFANRIMVTAMYKSLYRALAHCEDNHWWYRARRELVNGLLHKHKLHSAGRILDVGCGTGGNLVLFSGLDPDYVIGLDYSDQALDLARDKFPDAHWVRGNAAHPLPFAPRSFDLITIFGVLNHDWMGDEAAAVKEISSLLKDDGILVITEPAFKLLRRRMDKLGMSKKRYRVLELSQMAKSAGLDEVYASCFTISGFFPALLLALADRASLFFLGRSTTNEVVEMALPPQFLNKFFLTVSRLENRLMIYGIRFPLGVGVLGLYCRNASR